MEDMISFHDPELQGESFSLITCQDFNSPTYLGVFFDDSDDDCDEDDDDDSYIEISLERRPCSDDVEDDDLEFRISFSSSCLFPELHGRGLARELFLMPPKTLETIVRPDTDQTESFSSLPSPPRITSSTPSTQNTIFLPSESHELSHNPSKTTIAKSDSNNNNSNSNKAEEMMQSSSSTRAYSSEEGIGNETRDSTCSSHQSPQSTIQNEIHNNQELPRSRKVTKVTAAINGGLMKFFMKFKSMKIKSMLASYMKSREPLCPDHQHRDTHHRDYRRVIPKSFNRLQSVPGTGSTRTGVDLDTCLGSSNSCSTAIAGGSCSDQKSSRVLEVNLDTIRGVLEAMSISLNNISRREYQNHNSVNSKFATRSCPSSIKCSPIHRGVRPASHHHHHQSNGKIYTIKENSVEAAIAYCKRSLAQSTPPDFCFHFE
ncbi:uncharacterized protein LOC131159955 [Malania oleifera]|uniref:uncharacterized protein LOC131159955 n=1 Tax=Malania oleifera TaxID=397392 RepID=UPI0025AE9438|nr:uncharacterized protein LOC131159955 [Malania oleifera]